MVSPDTNLEVHLSWIDHLQHTLIINMKKQTWIWPNVLHGEMKYAYFIELSCALAELLSQLKNSKLRETENRPLRGQDMVVCLAL